MNPPQTWQRPPSRGGRSENRIDDAPNDTSRLARASNADAPGLIVRLSDPPRILILANDSDQESELRRIARAVADLLAALERERKAAA